MHTITLRNPEKKHWVVRLVQFFMRRNYKIPVEWNELSRSQVLGVSDVMFAKNSIYTSKLKLIKILTGLPWLSLIPVIAQRRRNKWELVSIISGEDQLFIGDHVEWVMKDKITLTNNLFRELHGLYGPLDKFKNVTVGEFYYADVVFNMYMKSNSISDLEKLCAILYRNKKNYLQLKSPTFNGDVRQPFNNHTIEYRLRRIRKWKAIEKYAILLYYYGCRALLAEKFPRIFKKNEITITDPEVVQEITNLYPMISRFSIRYENSIEKTMQVPLWDFMQEADLQLEVIENATKKK